MKIQKKPFLVLAAGAALVFSVSCASKDKLPHLEEGQIDDADFDEMVIVEEDVISAPPEADWIKEYNEHSGIDLSDADVYTVKKGDTLAKIARKEYGKKRLAFFFPLIMLASNKTVKDPDKIRPGMKLNVPNLKTVLGDDAERAQVKDYIVHIADLYKKAGKYQKTEKGLRFLAANLDEISANL